VELSAFAGNRRSPEQEQLHELDEKCVSKLGPSLAFLKPGTESGSTGLQHPSYQLAERAGCELGTDASDSDEIA
jgi:hypothetical protein